MPSSNLVIRQLGPADCVAIHDFRDRVPGYDDAVGFLEPRPQDLRRVAESIAAQDTAHGAVGVFVDDQLAGLANFVSSPTHTAEISVALTQDRRVRAAGGELLDRLAWLARSRGVTRFIAEAVAENVRLMRLVRETGWPYTACRRGGLPHVGIAID
jgi:hypothetical protein